MARKTRKHMGTIYERAGRRGFYWRVQLEGRRIKRFLAVRREDAESLVEGLTSRILRGEVGGPSRVDRIRFEEFVKTHLEQLQAEHTDTTYHDEENRWLNQISPHFRGRWVDEISTADVERFLAEVAKSPATRNRLTSLLSRLYKRAIAHGHAKDNPAAGVKRVREEERDVPALSLEEQDLIVESANERIRDYVLLSLDTGCRQGELLKLEWSAVDLARGTLTVRKARGKKPRVIPLTGRVRARLKEKKGDRTIPLQGPDLVLPELDGAFSRNVGALFKAAVAAAGYPDLRPHDLRHLCAVNLVRAGVPMPDVAEWLEHSRNSITVTMRYARHAPANAAERARDLLDAARQPRVSATEAG